MNQSVVRCVCVAMLVGAWARVSGGQQIATEHPSERTSMDVLTRLISVDLRGVSLKDAVDAVAKRAGVRVASREGTLPTARRVTYHADRVAFGIVLEQVLQGTGLRAEMLSKELVFIKRLGHTEEPMAQGGVAGTVVDAKTRLGLRGATITLSGTNKSTTSGDNGSFRLSGVTPGAYTVQVRMLGYVKTMKPVTVAEGQVVSLEIGMEPSVNALDQVVVTGTVVPTELKAVPNAVTVITAKDLEQRGITHIDQLFRGDVPGLFALDRGSQSLLDDVAMYARGATSLNEGGSVIRTFIFAGGPLNTIQNVPFVWFSNPIKTYVDGVELADPSYLSQLDPQSIERIEIIAGPQASTIYGSNAINGVMQVFTKRGADARPQVTASLLSGWVQNNFRPALTPQHDYTVQIQGTEGHFAYNGGISWTHMGRWTPAKEASRLNGFGGMRERRGAVTVDGTFRLATTQNRQEGDAEQRATSLRETGWWVATKTAGLAAPSVQALRGQTVGMTLGVSPVSWWSHEITVGLDRSESESRKLAPGYAGTTVGADTLLLLTQITATRRSARMASTVTVPLSTEAKITMTVGGDAWASNYMSLTVSPPQLTGTLAGNTSVSRRPDRNSGGFVQTQVALGNSLFLTHGIRAEWNPNYGEAAQPNLAPRYGVAFTRELGRTTMKLRAAYGRSTRPPEASQKLARKLSVAGISTGGDLRPDYGDFEYYLENPDLGPETQQGGESGIELYFDRWGSLVVTRYSQTVNGLITEVTGVDSVRSVRPNPFSAYSYDDEGYGYYYVAQYLNVGNTRNQGWELQGRANVGVIMMRGTYSWTKSRVIGIDPRYRGLFNLQRYPQYQPGASFKYLPEHTWAFGATYSTGKTIVGLDFTGTGQTVGSLNELYLTGLHPQIRLSTNRIRITDAGYVNRRSGMTFVDLNASHRIAQRMEWVLQVRNLADTYRNDYNASFATLGRQTKTGLRIRL